MHDQLACGQRFRVLNIVDDVTRECLAAISVIVSDYASDVTSNAILAWSNYHRAEWHYIAPGKPMQNGYVGASTAACATRS